MRTRKPKQNLKNLKGHFSVTYDRSSSSKLNTLYLPEMISDTTLDLQIQRGADALQLSLRDHGFTIWTKEKQDQCLPDQTGRKTALQLDLDGSGSYQPGCQLRPCSAC